MLSQGIVELLKNFYLFQGIDTERLEELTRNAQVMELEAGDVIFFKNDLYHKGLYLLTCGRVGLSTEMEDELELVQGEFLGLSTFMAKSRYSSTARCIEDCTFIFFPEVCIYKLTSDYSDFKDRFQKLTFDRINRISGLKTDSILHSTFRSVGSYMSSPVQSVGCLCTISEACGIMSKYKIGAVVVTDEKKRLAGLLNAKNVLHKYFEDFDSNQKITDISFFMDKNPVSVPPEFPLVNALTEMQRTGDDYAVVVSNYEPIGIVSSKDIIRVLFNDASIYGTNIDSSDSLDDLKIIHQELYKIATSMMNSSKLTSDILPVLSSLHIGIQKKIYQLTATSYETSTGVDVRQIKHALMIMGSLGRKESMLDPDQDNGYIFPDDISETDRTHMVEFGKMLSASMDFVGYEYCQGGIMVTNPEMSMTISEWKKIIGEWIDNPGEKGVRWSSIIFDLTLLEGEDRLVWDLRNFILKKVSQKPVFLLQMLQNDANLRIPISIFGKFITEKEGEHEGEINLKRAALAFIVDVVRSIALYNQIQDINTIERLRHIQRLNILAEETVSNIINAYETVTDILLNHQVKTAKDGGRISKFVNPKTLSLYNQEKLKNALNTISKFLNTGLRYFSGSPF